MTGPLVDLRAEAERFALALEGYDPRLQPAAIATWRARLLNEYSSASVFESLGAQLETSFESPELGVACRAFAREERRHGALCAAVVLALGGEPVARPRDQPPFPLHSDVPRRAAALRNLIHVACMSETVAVSLIGAERLEMPRGPLRTLLTRIYSDEVGHARFGWKFLERVAPTLEPEERSAIERYLPVAFAHLEHHELSHLPDIAAPTGGEMLGLCSGREARALFFQTVTNVIRPGLRRWFS